MKTSILTRFACLFMLWCNLSIAQKPGFISPAGYIQKTGFDAFFGKPFDSLVYKADDTQVKSLTAIMQTFKGFENYPIGLCETRAHYISLLANEMKINTFKVWLFSRSKTDIFSTDGLTLKSNPTLVAWDYHVATAIYNNKGKILVFDPVINSNSPLPLEEWLSAFNASGSIYFYTAPGYFQFNTSAASILAQPKNLLNGKFWKLASNATNDESFPKNPSYLVGWKDYLTIRLAASNLASQNMQKTGSEFYKLITNATNYKNWFVDASDPSFPEERKILNAHKKQYENLVSKVTITYDFFFVPVQ
ncbi:MAG: hypothetical protein JWO44_2669 [Bacteroidetes bacterium]|nr:hypothetical protein [Bacteroidota bacterium]